VNSQKYQPFFFWWPWTFVNSGSQMIVPSFSTLLATALNEVCRYSGPVFCTLSFDEISQNIVLLLCPWIFGLSFGRLPFVRQLSITSHYLKWIFGKCRRVCILFKFDNWILSWGHFYIIRRLED
jgi:hypothetical protein